MKQNILISIIAVVIIVAGLTIYFKEKESTKIQTPTNTQMDMSMPGMDHDLMEIN